MVYDKTFINLYAYRLVEVFYFRIESCLVQIDIS